MSVEAEIGSDVILQCTADGYPPPTIQWLHYGTVVRETDNITVSEETVNSTTVTSSLEIGGLRSRQYGQYQCRAGGTVDSETATLSFSGKHTHQDRCETIKLSMAHIYKQHVYAVVPY